MIWFLMIIIALAAFVWIALPLFRAEKKSSARAEGELAVYRDQLSEIDGDVARGLISKEQATVDEIEISRRMLAVSGPDKGMADKGLTPNSRYAFFGILAVIAVLAPFTVYSQMGAPELEGQPYVKAASASPEHASSDMTSAIDRLVARLDKNPDDFEGWVLLARSYEFSKDLGNAAEAYGRAFELRSEDANIAGSYAEAMTTAQGGMVSPKAKLIFEQLRQENPDDPRNHYYVGIAEVQAGQGQAAIDTWQALLAASPSDAPWVPGVRQQIEQAAQQFSLEVGEIKTLPSSRSASVASAPVIPGPTAEDVAAASQMTSDEQTKMIRSMVERLAGRLEENPDDIEGWLRLARAQAVLDGPAGAKPSLERAFGAATSEASRQAILAAARDLGVTLDGS